MIAKDIEQRAYFGFPSRWDFAYNERFVSNFENNFAPSITEVEAVKVDWDFSEVIGEGIFSNEVFIRILSEVQAQYKNTNNEELLGDLLEVFRIFIFEAWKSLFMHNFFLATANGDCLELWGYILGLSREFPISAINKDYNYFNFDYKRFYQLIFYNPATPEFAYLTDDAFKEMLLLLLQRQFIENDTDAINNFLDNFFSAYGGIRLEDSTNMERGFVWFLDSIPVFLRYYIFNKDILPRPACVGMGVGINANKYFGFETPELSYNQRYVGAFQGTSFLNVAYI